MFVRCQPPVLSVHVYVSVEYLGNPERFLYWDIYLILHTLIPPEGVDVALAKEA